MARSGATLFVLLVSLSALAAPPTINIPRQLLPGTYDVTVSMYALPEGGTAIATEKRLVAVDASGTFSLPLGSLASTVSTETRWMAVSIGHAPETHRIAVAPNTPGHVKVLVISNAITANGYVQSMSGFRFPDDSIQTTAASIAFGTPVTISTGNSAGVLTTLSRSDHVHAHGNLIGGTLHASATTSSAGFMSSTDKTKLDGLTAYVRTIVVSPTVGDATASGTTLVNALNGISGNSAANPYLLKIEPGVYNIGAGALTMKTYVDIEGSGENVTLINATRGSGSITSAAAMVIGAANAELRNLTISNVATSTTGAGFFSNTSGAISRLRDVTINQTGASSSNYGAYITGGAILYVQRSTITATQFGTSGATGIFVFTGSTLDVRHSTVTAKGGSGSGTMSGVQTNSSTAIAKIDSSEIVATANSALNQGVNVTFGDVTITNSTVRVDTAGTRVAVSTSASVSSKMYVHHSLLLAFTVGFNASELSAAKGTNSILQIGTSQIDSSSTGTPKCVHVYDADMDDLGNACPAPIA